MRLSDIPIISSADVPEDKIFFFPAQPEFHVPTTLSLARAASIIRSFDVEQLQAGLAQYGFERIEADVPEWLRVSEGL